MKAGQGPEIEAVCTLHILLQFPIQFTHSLMPSLTWKRKEFRYETCTNRFYLTQTVALKIVIVCGYIATGNSCYKNNGRWKEFNHRTLYQPLFLLPLVGKDYEYECYCPHPAEPLLRTKLRHNSLIPHSMPPHIYLAPKVDLVATCSRKKFLLVVY